MKYRFVLFDFVSGVLFSLLLAGCVASEPLEVQCDLFSVKLSTSDGSEVLRSQNTLKGYYMSSDSIKAAEDLTDSVFPFYLKEKVAVGSYRVNTVAHGGTMVYLVSEDGVEMPFVDGSSVDFSINGGKRTFVTYSAGEYTERSDKKMYTSQRRYTVSVTNDTTERKGESVYVTFDFNGNYALNSRGKYYIWTEKDKTIFLESDPTWKNGNPGFLLSRSSAAAMDYPTVPVVDGGMDGTDCVKLETRDTGAFGAMVGAPIAAGSLFNGVFNVARATKEPRKSTQFGVSCPYVPLCLDADVKYIPGETFRDIDTNPVTGVVDEPDIYCVFYKNHGGRVVLDGDNILTSEDIVASARLMHHYTYNKEGNRLIPIPLLSGDPIHGLTDEWQHVSLDLDFDPFQTGEENIVDIDTLRAGGYSVVFGSTSSWRGAVFEGALGSQLFFDNVKITMLNPKQENKE